MSHLIVINRGFTRLVVNLQLHLYMAKGRFQNHVAVGHGDNLTGGIVMSLVGPGDHIPSTEGGALLGHSFSSGKGNRLSSELDDFANITHILKGNRMSGSIQHSFRQIQLQSIFDLLIKQTSMQAAIIAVMVGDNLARRDHRLLVIHCGIQFHFNDKIQFDLAAQPLNGHVQTLAVLAGGGGQAGHGAAGLIPGAGDLCHQGLVGIQLQGKMDVVVMVVDELLQIGGHFLLHQDGIIGSVSSRIFLSRIFMSLNVLGSILGQQLIGLCRILPGNQRICTGLEFAVQLLQLFLNRTGIFRSECPTQHPKDHGGVSIPSVSVLYRLDSCLQCRRLIGGTLTRIRLVNQLVVQICFAGQHPGVLHNPILIVYELDGGPCQIVIDVAQTAVKHHLSKGHIGSGALTGGVHQEDQVKGVCLNPLFVIGNGGLRAGRIFIVHCDGGLLHLHLGVSVIQRQRLWVSRHCGHRQQPQYQR